MIAAHTWLPVLGVPVQSHALEGHGFAALDRADAGRRRRWGRSPSAWPARRMPRCSRPASSALNDEKVRDETGSVSQAADRRGARRNACHERGDFCPGATIGVMGGGQLGRMFAIAARRMGYRVHIFTPEKNTPAGQFADREVHRRLRRRSGGRAFSPRRRCAHLRVRKYPAPNDRMVRARECDVRPARRDPAHRAESAARKKFPRRRGYSGRAVSRGRSASGTRECARSDRTPGDSENARLSATTAKAQTIDRAGVDARRNLARTARRTN